MALSEYFPATRYLFHLVMRPRVRRRLTWLALAVVVFVSILLSAIQIEKQLFRRRVEQLLTDIRSIQLRTTTSKEADALLLKWSTASRRDPQCTADTCRIEVQFANLFFRQLERLQRFPSVQPTLFELYLAAGARPARAYAQIEVYRGQVWSKGFGFYVEVPGEQGRWPYSLIAEAETVSRFRFERGGQLLLHPEYIVGRPGGCTVCELVYGKFTPFADPADIDRLTRFDLSCLTRLFHPCRHQADIMPVAWHQYTAESEQAMKAYLDRSCAAEPLWLLGRDSENVAVVEVVSQRIETTETETYQVWTVRLLQRIKASAFWNVGATREVTIVEDAQSSAARTGQRLILIFDDYSSQPGEPAISIEECGAIPLNARNLMLVQAGVSRDYRASQRP